jgi:DNA phosphorothioation-associated putative methyltransferase
LLYNLLILYICEIGLLTAATVLHDLGKCCIKFHTDKPCISYLYYPDFESIAHPALQWAMLIDLRDLSLRFRDYSQQENPPILHRKETFLSASHPLHAKFAKFTKSEEKAGLYTETKTIGNQQGWERRLQSCGVQIKNHRVIRNA